MAQGLADGGPADAHALAQLALDQAISRPEVAGYDGIAEPFQNLVTPQWRQLSKTQNISGHSFLQSDASIARTPGTVHRSTAIMFCSAQNGAARCQNIGRRSS
jgi:hypothetical protein